MNKRSWVKRVMMAAFCGAAALSYANDPGTVFYWTGGSGNWSDKANWSLSEDGKTEATRYPGGDSSITDDSAIFAFDAHGTINIDVEVTLYRFTAAPRYGVTDFTELIFSGAGKLTCTSTGNSVNDRCDMREGRNVTFQNCNIKSSHMGFYGSNDVIGAGANMEINGTLYSWKNITDLRILSGANVKCSGILAYAPSSKVTIEGGDIACNSIVARGNDSKVTVSGANIIRLNSSEAKIYSEGTNSEVTVLSGNIERMSPLSLGYGSKFTLAGGRIRTSKTIPSVATDSTFNFTGGTLVWTADYNFSHPCFLGSSENCVLDYQPTSAKDRIIAPFNEFGGTEYNVRFDGTLYVTNGATFSVTNAGCVYGKGKMYLGPLTFRVAKDNYYAEFKLDIAELGLKGTLTQGTWSNIRFGDGMKLRSCGNWKSCTVTFWNSYDGDITIDTSDCLDSTKDAHSAMMRGVRMTNYSKLEATGGGTVTISNYYPYSAYKLKELKIGDNTTLKVYGTINADKLTMGDNSKLMFAVTNSPWTVSVADIADTATIEAEARANAEMPVRGLIYVGSGMDDDDVADKITVTGAGAEGYSKQNVGGCVYLRGAGAYEYEEVTGWYVWNGASTKGNTLYDADNWLGGVAPGSGKDSKMVFGGYDNLDITNTSSGYHSGSFTFTTNCGLVRISGYALRPTNYGWFSAGCSFWSASTNPVTIAAEVIGNSRVEAVANASYIAFTGGMTPRDDLLISGYVKMLCNCTIPSGLVLDGNSNNSTIFEVGDGAEVNVNNNADFSYSNNHRQICIKNATLKVNRGGMLRYAAGTDAKYGWGYNNLTHRIDGDLQVCCPMSGYNTQTYDGEGTFFVDNTLVTNANNTIVLKGGIQFSAREFNTASAVWPANYMRLKIDGEATFTATNNWSYKPGTAATTTAEDDRAIMITSDSELTIANTGDNTIAFGDKITGSGTLKFEDGAKIDLAGSLKNAAYGHWATLAEVGAVEGKPTLPDGYEAMIEATEDGAVLKIKHTVGLTVIIR